MATRTATAKTSRSRVIMFVATASWVLVACGFAFAPGDYNEPTQGAPTVIGASGDGSIGVPGSDTGTSKDVDAPTDGGGPNTRIIIVGGRREPLPNESTSTQYFVPETLKTTLLPTGEITPFTYDNAPPQSSTWTASQTLNGSLFLQASTSAFSATFSDHITSEWTPLALRGGSPASYQRATMFTGGLLAAGGFSNQNSSALGDVYFAPFNLGDGGIDPWQIQPPKLVKARGDVTLLRTAKYLYAIGGRESTSSVSPGRSEVEVATLDATGLPQTFQATTPLTNPESGSSLGLITPGAASGDGFVFVVGGATAANGQLSDIAVAAKIDDATGMLGPWMALPKLATQTTSISLLFANDRLYAFGGQTQQGPLSDAVMSVTIKNGTLGTEWITEGKLPNRRSGLVTMVY